VPGAQVAPDTEYGADSGWSDTVYIGGNEIRAPFGGILVGSGDLASGAPAAKSLADVLERAAAPAPDAPPVALAAGGAPAPGYLGRAQALSAHGAPMPGMLLAAPAGAPALEALGASLSAGAGAPARAGARPANATGASNVLIAGNAISDAASFAVLVTDADEVLVRGNKVHAAACGAGRAVGLGAYARALGPAMFVDRASNITFMDNSFAAGAACAAGAAAASVGRGTNTSSILIISQ
jgi:hypothetical protein